MLGNRMGLPNSCYPIPLPNQSRKEQLELLDGTENNSGYVQISGKLNSLKNLINSLLTECLHGQQLLYCIALKHILDPPELAFKHVLEEIRHDQRFKTFIYALKLTMRPSL